MISIASPSMLAVGLIAAPPPDEEIAESAQSLLATIADAAPRVAVAVAIVLSGWIVGRGVRWLLHRRFQRRRTASFANVMSKIASWLFVAAVVLVAIAITFPSVKPVDILAGLGFFSVAVGFAFQDILENTLSGILLLFRQPFRSGDQITVMGQSGTVEGITIRETRLTTFDGELVVIPNRDVYKNVIEVHTHHPVHRIRFTVGIAYDADPDEAIGVIHAALDETSGVRTDPRPVVVLDEFAASTVDVAVMFWTDSGRLDSITIRDAAMRRTKLRLDEAEVDLPTGIVALQATPSFGAAMRGDGPES